MECITGLDDFKILYFSKLLIHIFFLTAHSATYSLNLSVTQNLSDLKIEGHPFE